MLLTVADVAKELGVSTETVRRMIQAGELPAQRASNAPRAAWLIDPVQLEGMRPQRAVARQRLGGVKANGHEPLMATLDSHKCYRIELQRDGRGWAATVTWGMFIPENGTVRAWTKLGATRKALRRITQYMAANDTYDGARVEIRDGNS